MDHLCSVTDEKCDPLASIAGTDAWGALMEHVEEVNQTYVFLSSSKHLACPMPVALHCVQAPA